MVLGFGADCIKIVVSMATDRSHRLTMGKTKKIFFSETTIIQSLRGHSCAREVQRKFIHKWLETYLRCKKIEGDQLKSWCGPRNPRWPPRCWPIFLKMTVYIKLATTTYFYLVFGLKMIVLEENRYK